jgi:hypothetical protein
LEPAKVSPYRMAAPGTLTAGAGSLKRRNFAGHRYYTLRIVR